LEILSLPGKPIGMFEDIKYKQKKIKLVNGDRLLLFTDGLLEIKNKDGAILGMKGFMKIIDSHLNKRLNNFIEEILSDLNTFQGNMQKEDDILLVVFEVTL